MVLEYHLHTANTATNELFLLSQAHQELMKSEAQHTYCSNGDDSTFPSNATSKRDTKRKSYNMLAFNCHRLISPN